MPSAPAAHPRTSPEKIPPPSTARWNRLGLSFDWTREVNTSDPSFYRWTQWIFIKLFEKGLAHKQEMPINWCPKDKVGLANEEVIDGHCERCGTQWSAGGSASGW